MVKYSATIQYDAKNNHPDAPGATGLEYSDVYAIDPNYFYGSEDINDYIKHDLALVAGGGYETNTIKNVRYTIVTC